jgi:hypothetical protein
MQPIRDKDLDELFKQRFEDLEESPLADSWKKITNALEKTDKKRYPYPVWMAAASAAILVAAGLWLYKPTELIKLQGKPETLIAVNSNGQPLVTEVLNDSHSKVAEVKIAQKKPVKIHKEPSSHKLKVYVQRVQKQANFAKVTLENLQTSLVVIAKQENKLPLKTTENTAVTENKAPLFITQTEVSKTEDNQVAETPRPRIKSVGGLVNFVISRVDKREDKIIEFKDGKEGSELSGINLGLLKFKNRNR